MTPDSQADPQLAAQPDTKAETNPCQRHKLGEVVINGVRAELFVCDGIALARFSPHPDDYEAAHLKSLSVTSNVFLLVAFRLYLDRHLGTSSSGHHAPSALQS